MDIKQPDILYHYCPLDSFYKIMESSMLRLSDVKKSNDSLELKWVYILCKRLITRKFADIATTSILNKYKKGAPTNDIKLNKALDDFENSATFANAKNTCTAWVFCFSEKPDSLDQWRGYANNGNGIAIGFRREYLSTINNVVLPPESNLQSKLEKIEYDISDETYEQILGINDIQIETPHITNSQAADRAINLALKAPPIYKNPSFREEKEWRLYFKLDGTNGALYDESYIVNKSDIFNGNFEVKEQGFNIRRNRIVSYIPLFIPKENRIKAIREIIIGPTADVSRTDILYILKRYGYISHDKDCPIQIRQSESSYYG